MLSDISIIMLGLELTTAGAAGLAVLSSRPHAMDGSGSAGIMLGSLSMVLWGIMWLGLGFSSARKWGQAPSFAKPQDPRA